MTAPHLSARTLALLADPVRLRRLRSAHRDDAQTYAELCAVSALVFAHIAGHANVTDLGVSVIPEPALSLTTQQAAAQLGITESGVRRALLAGRLTGRHHGGRWLIDPHSVAEYATRAA